jgi:hypothetical protein
MWFEKIMTVSFASIALLLGQDYAHAVEDFVEKCAVIYDSQLDSNRPVNPIASYNGIDEQQFVLFQNEFKDNISQNFPSYNCNNNNCSLQFYDYDLYFNKSFKILYKIRDYMQVCTIKHNYCIDDDCKTGTIIDSTYKINWDGNSVLMSHAIAVGSKSDFDLEAYFGEALYKEIEGYVNRAQSKAISNSSVFQIFEYRRD